MFSELGVKVRDRLEATVTGARMQMAGQKWLKFLLLGLSLMAERHAFGWRLKVPHLEAGIHWGLVSEGRETGTFINVNLAPNWRDETSEDAFPPLNAMGPSFRLALHM